MANEFEQRLQAIDRTMLTPLVRRALEKENVEVIDWHYAPIEGGFSAVHGVYRWWGTAQGAGATRAWSLILKATGAPTTGSQAPSALDYWQREALLYRAGLLDHLREGLVAPRCFAVVEQASEEFWIWLEDIVPAEDAPLDEEGYTVWPFARYGLAARHLGQFNGAYLTGRPLPAAPWLSSGRLDHQLTLAESGIRALPPLRSHPLFQDLLAGDSVERILQLWAKRERLLAVLDRLPRTFCHHDAFRRNLIARRGRAGQEQTVAIDWDMAGIGAVGAEIDPLFAVTLRFVSVDTTRLAELDSIIFASYLDGLRDAGWQGDQRLVRFGFTATAVLHHLSHLAITLPRVAERAAIAAQRGDELPRPLGPGAAQMVAVQHYLLELGDEASRLMDGLATVHRVEQPSSK